VPSRGSICACAARLHHHRAGSHCTSEAVMKALGFLVRFLPLLAMAALSPPISGWTAEVRSFEGYGPDSAWSYQGEVAPFSGESGQGGGFCKDNYCANGYGSYSSEGGIDYTGTFRNGQMDGTGTYTTDFYEYVGGFRRGKFNGHGTLKCYHGSSFKFDGMFIDGKMEGSDKPVGFGCPDR
jgi:hypothetical protein